MPVVLTELFRLLQHLLELLEPADLAALRRGHLSRALADREPAGGRGLLVGDGGLGVGLEADRWRARSRLRSARREVSRSTQPYSMRTGSPRPRNRSRACTLSMVPGRTVNRVPSPSKRISAEPWSVERT